MTSSGEVSLGTHSLLTHQLTPPRRVAVRSCASDANDCFEGTALLFTKMHDLKSFLHTMNNGGISKMNLWVSETLQTLFSF